MTSGRNTRGRGGNNRNRARVEGSIVSKVIHHDYLVGRAKQHGETPLMALTTVRSRFPRKALEVLHKDFVSVLDGTIDTFTVNSFGHDFHLTLSLSADDAYDIVVLGDKMEKGCFELLDNMVPTSVLLPERQDFLPDLSALFTLFELKEEVHKYLAGRALAAHVLRLSAFISPLPDYGNDAVVANLDPNANVHFPSILKLLEDNSPQAVEKIFDFAERTSGLIRLGFEDHLTTSKLPTDVAAVPSAEVRTTPEEENDMTQKTDTPASLNEAAAANASDATPVVRRTAATDPIVAEEVGEVITIGADDDFNESIRTAAKYGAIVVGAAIVGYVGYRLYSKLTANNEPQPLPLYDSRYGY